ncbi:plasmid transfer protein TraA [Streptomyces sp. NBC_00525]|uniref:plasmid transfer protein TraA n=1 Tax=Streptomyces sp. NBC_00525 TaxID=2903660 RepID=UPI002E809392|nr:plasmid transfer protein TraA [Streptomyces sp. NBC_00525]WUC94434.1 sporulation protein SsgA [Streptomyces sp. NBC_00525]
MASSPSQQARDFARQQAARPFTPPPRRNSSGQTPGSKGAKFAAGAATAAGNFVGAAAGGFVPPINVTVNNTKNAPAAAPAPSGGGSHFVLGEPTFDNTDDVRNYCNHVRALMIQAAIELAMASKILEARLSQAQTLPGDNLIQGRMRARSVSRKLKKAADGATAAAKSAVGAYGAFTREYADLMSPRPQRAATTNPFKF